MEMTEPREPKPSEASASADKVATDMKRLSDAVLWKNHRAPEELRVAVNMVANELFRTADAIQACGPALATLRDEATVQGHLALLEAKDKLALLDDLVRTALNGAQRSPSFIGETARLKLALARMDANDFFEQKRRLLTKERRRIESMTDAALKELDERLGELAKETQPKK